MASTHKKQLTTTVRPGSMLSNQDIIAVVSGDTDIGGRIASVNDLRFSTASGLWLEWMPIAFSLVGGSLTATFRIVRPTILSSEDLVTEIHYGGTPDGSAPGPASTLSLPGLVGAWDMESVNPTDWSGHGNDAVGVNSPATEAGKLGDAIRLSAVESSYVAAGSDPSLTFDMSFTIMAWIRRYDTGLHSIASGNGAGWGDNWWFTCYFATGELRLYRGSAYVARVGNVPVGSYAHVAVTRSLTGVVNLRQRITNRVRCDTSRLYLRRERHCVGAGGGAYRVLTGNLDDCRIYSTPISPDSLAYIASLPNSPGIWGPEIALASTGFKRLLKRRSLGQDLFNGSLICG